MSRVIPRTARAAVTAGLSAALAFGTLPTPAIAEALAESKAAAEQALAQAQQGAQEAEANAEAKASDANDAADGADAASKDEGAAAKGEGDADAKDGAGTDAQADAAADAEDGAATKTDATIEETKTVDVPVATLEQAPTVDAAAAVTPVANEVAKITRNRSDTLYAKLSEAVAALQDGDTLTILQTTAENVIISNKQNVTITSANKDTVAYQGWMQITGGNGNKVTGVHFDVQPRVDKDTGNQTNWSTRGLELFDASNVTVENNKFTLPEDAPNRVDITIKLLDVNCLYVAGQSGGLKVLNNTFDLAEHGSTNHSMSYRAIALRGRDVGRPNDKTLDGVTIAGNTINMTGKNSPGNASSIFVDAVGGLSNPNYGIKNVVIDKNTINGGQTASDGTTNVTFGFLAVGIDGLTFTNNTVKKLGYAVIFGQDTTGSNKTQKIDNVKIGGNDLSTTDWDLYTSKDGKHDAFENHVGDGGVTLIGYEPGKANTTAFAAGIRDKSDQPISDQNPFRLYSSLNDVLTSKVTTDGKPYDVIVTKDATTGASVAATQNVTLDLNDKTVSGTSTVEGQLTVKNTSTAAAGKLSGTVNVTDAGTLTVEGGTVDAKVTSAAGTSVTVKSGKVTGAVTSSGDTAVSGGTVSGALAVNGSGTATVSDKGTVSGAVTAVAGSTLAVSGGTMSGNVTTAGTMNVTGGMVTGKIVAQSGAKVTISGGTVGDIEAQPGSTVTITNGAIIKGVVTGNGIAANGATVKIEGGTFDKAPKGAEGVVTITGGSFSEKPDILHSENLKGFAQGADGKWGVVDVSLEFTNAVQNVNGTDTYTIDIKDTIAGSTNYNEQLFKSLAKVVNKGDQRVDLYGYTVTVDSAETVGKIDAAVKNKDTTQTFELTYVAKKDGTARDAKFEKTLTVKLVDTRAPHTVTFDTDGGTSGTIPSQQVKHGDLVNEPTEPTKTGHTFQGWYNGATKWDFKTNAMPDADLTLTAQWKVDEHKVSFDANANGDQSVTGMPNEITGVQWNTQATEPVDVPTREGYNFKGWYKDKNGQNPYTWSDPVMGNMTLYAKWSIKTFTVTFDGNGGNDQVGNLPGQIQDVEWNTAVNKPTDEPTRTGYTFGGWYTDKDGKTPYTWSNPVKKDVTLYAKWNINNYTLTFDGNAGSDAVDKLPSSIQGTHGQVVAEPADHPEREGYAFTAWYTDPTNQIDSTKFDWSKGLTGAQKLYAGWQAKSYKLTFNLDGGQGTFNERDVTYREKAADPGTPTKEGYDFQGWVDQDSKPWDFKTNTMPAKNVTLTATWKAQKRTITLDANGGNLGTVPSTVETEYDTPATKPNDEPSKEGHTFQGWYTDKDGATPYNWGDHVTQDLTLYAKWDINKYTVSFQANANGDTTVQGMPNAISAVAWNTTVSDPTPDGAQKPTRTGYTFTGWFSDPAAQTPFDFAKTPIKDNTEVYAGWKLNSYGLHFEANSEGDDVANMPADQSVSHGSKPSALNHDPKREGYEFDGWYTDAQNQTADTKFDWEKPVTGQVTLYAKWNVKSYALSFDSNGGKETYTTQHVNFRDLAQDPGTPNRDGYTFVGWYNGETEWDFKEIAMPAEDLTLTAKWMPQEYTATFDQNYLGAPAAGTAKIYHDGTVPAPTDPKRDGYEFNGWYKDPAGVEAYDWSTTVTGNVTLYAQWVAGENQVTFDSDGGTNVPGVAVKTDELVPEPGVKPTKTGYDFQGWFLEGVAWDFTANKMPAKDITLKAKWTLHQYDVSFDVNGGDSKAPETQKVEYQKTAARPQTPARNGYTFAGWMDENGNWYDFATPVTRDIKLTAQWTAKKHTLTFVYNTGAQNLTEDIYYDGTVAEPADPQREGYDFAGWYTGADFAEGSKYDFSAKVTGDVTLYARWQIWTFTVSFEANAGGDASVANMPGSLDKVEWNTTISDPTPDGTRKLTRTGYTFTGWFADAEAKTPFDFAKTPIKGDTKVYAGWAINEYTLRFDANAGQDAVTNVPADLLVNHGGALTEPTQQPEREGYEFDGWYTDKDNQSAATKLDWTKPLTAGQTVYAKWKVRSYRLVFDVAGGQGFFAEQAVSYRSLAANPGSPTRAGYTFAGWFNGSEQWDFTKSAMPAADVTLAAKWVPLEYTATFDQNYLGAPVAGTATIYHDGTVAAPANPQREGYDFGGWYTTADFAEGSEYDFSAKVTGDVTLYAKWVEKAPVDDGKEEQPQPDATPEDPQLQPDGAHDTEQPQANGDQDRNTQQVAATTRGKLPQTSDTAWLAVSGIFGAIGTALIGAAVVLKRRRNQ